MYVFSSPKDRNLDLLQERDTNLYDNKFLQVSLYQLDKRVNLTYALTGRKAAPWAHTLQSMRECTLESINECSQTWESKTSSTSCMLLDTREPNQRKQRNRNLDLFLHSTQRSTCFAGGMGRGRNEEAQEGGSIGFTS